MFYTDTPLYGGAEKQMLVLAKHLNRQKYQPVFVARKSEALENWYQAVRKAGVELHLINSTSKNSPSNLSALLKTVFKIKPALIHAHLWNPVACKYIFPIAWAGKTPIVTTEHDPFPLSGHRKIYKKLTLRQTARIITVSHANLELMEKLYPKQRYKMTAVHNGIEEYRHKVDHIQKIRLKKSVFGVGPETGIIFSAGALHPRKGFKFLISAFHNIADKLENTKLVIAGLGPSQPELIKLVKNLGLEKKVVLLGYRDDIEDLMQCSDVFVLPSLKEAFGLVIPEAMQNGLPVIASRVGGIPEIISSEDLGVLIKPGNKQSLAKALYKLLTNPELMRKLSANGLQHWRKFSAAEMARQTEAVYYLALNR